jgi:hypothetical protein
MNKNGSDGMNIQNSGLLMYPSLTQNVLTANADNGISLGNTGTMEYIYIGSNSISSNKNDGINIVNGSGDSGCSTDYSYRLFCENGNNDNVQKNIPAAISFLSVDFNAISLNSGDGISIQNTGNIGNVEVAFNTISSNKGDGMNIQNGSASDNYDHCYPRYGFCWNGWDHNNYDNSGNLSDFYAYNNIIKNNKGNGISLNGAGFSNIFLGIDANGFGGSNSIYSNGDGRKTFNLTNNSGINKLPAQGNYWGGGAGKFGGTNTVSAEPYLIADPN